MNCLFAHSNVLAGSASTKLNSKLNSKQKYYCYYYYYYGRLNCRSIVLNKIQSKGSTGLGNYTIYKSRKKTAKAKATNKIHNKVIKIDAVKI